MVLLSYFYLQILFMNVIMMIWKFIGICYNYWLKKQGSNSESVTIGKSGWLPVIGNYIAKPGKYGHIYQALNSWQIQIPFFFPSSGFGLVLLFVLSSEEGKTKWDKNKTDPCEPRHCQFSPCLHVFCSFNKLFSWFKITIYQPDCNDTAWFF